MSGNTSDQWVIEREDGSQEVVSERPRKRLHGDFKRFARVDRPPCADGTEDWDFATWKWVANTARALVAVNARHCGRADTIPLDVMHAIKLIEARQVLGRPMTIAVEAELLGIPIEELARRIVAQGEVGVAAEHERVAARRTIREAGV